MTSFLVDYRTSGMLSMFTSQVPIIAANVKGAKEMFQLFYPNQIFIYASPYGLYELNGMYSRYFTSSKNVCL